MSIKDSLIICESFYSIQGEGKFVGSPSVFLRLAGCNLRCNGFSYVDPNTKEHLGCDTKAVWRKGYKISFTELIVNWQQQGFLAALNKGAHLVITGGEPLIQQEALVYFLQTLQNNCTKPLFIELETNATKLLIEDFGKKLSQINASPKLTSSGELREKSYIFLVLEQLAKNPKTSFKFVIKYQKDIFEVMENYIKPLAITNNRVWLMPEGGVKQEIIEKSLWIVDICKEYGFNFSQRLHIHLWNEATGV